MDIKNKSELSIDIQYEGLMAKDDKRRYNQGSPLQNYYYDNKDKLKGWSFNKFLSYIQGLNKTQVEIEYRKKNNRFGSFSKWI